MYHEVEFLNSSSGQDNWPENDLPEIALAGRSNVGKSSFINTIINRKAMAYVGKTPGKTRLLNFFRVDNKLVLVDVPGYGYANISKQALINFGQMMEDYFANRKQLKALVIVVDSRHTPNEDDLSMLEFARYFEIPTLVVATKADKLKNSERVKKLRNICQTLEIAEDELIEFSAFTNKGVNEVWDKLYQLIEIK